MRTVIRQFVTHVVPGVVKPLRILWNEVIGFVFLALAAVPLPRTWRVWRDYEATGEGLFNLSLSCLFILIMASFGATSFLRARKIGRS